MRLSIKQRSILGNYKLKPETVDPETLEAMADTLLASEKKRGRRPAGQSNYLTERQIRDRRAKEIPLGNNVRFLSANPDKTGFFSIVKRGKPCEYSS